MRYFRVKYKYISPRSFSFHKGGNAMTAFFEASLSTDNWVISHDEFTCGLKSSNLWPLGSTWFIWPWSYNLRSAILRIDQFKLDISKWSSVGFLINVAILSHYGWLFYTDLYQYLIFLEQSIKHSGCIMDINTLFLLVRPVLSRHRKLSLFTIPLKCTLVLKRRH